MKKMKKISILIVISCFTLVAQKAPKVDLDRFTARYFYQKLPKNNVAFDSRTFQTIVSISNSVYNYYPDNNVLDAKIGITGWKKVNDNATVKIEFNLNEFIQNSVENKNRLVEEKDKDGKVTKSYYLYSYNVSYTGKGINIFTTNEAVKNNNVVPPTEVPKENNRFLQKTSASAAVAAAGVTLRKYPVVETLNVQSIDFNTAEAADKHYKINNQILYEKNLREFVDTYVNKTNYGLNDQFGFPAYSENETLWIIDSKEEEGQIQKEAIDAVKKIFEKNIVADISLDQAILELEPLLTYFESLKTKYPDDNKGCKKIRYSAYYNLGKIYLALDQPEKAIKEGEGLIANDYDKGDGERIIKRANELIELLKSTNFSSRHNKALN